MIHQGRGLFLVQRWWAVARWVFGSWWTGWRWWTRRGAPGRRSVAAGVRWSSGRVCGCRRFRIGSVGGSRMGSESGGCSPLMGSRSGQHRRTARCTGTASAGPARGRMPDPARHADPGRCRAEVPGDLCDHHRSLHRPGPACRHLAATRAGRVDHAPYEPIPSVSWDGQVVLLSPEPLDHGYHVVLEASCTAAATGAG